MILTTLPDLQGVLQKGIASHRIKLGHHNIHTPLTTHTSHTPHHTHITHPSPHTHHTPLTTHTSHTPHHTHITHPSPHTHHHTHITYPSLHTHITHTVIMYSAKYAMSMITTSYKLMGQQLPGLPDLFHHP